MRTQRIVLSVCGVLLAGMAARAAEEATIPDWVNKISLGGDLRTRYEFIDQEGKDTRDRWRIRARLSLDAAANDDLDVYLRFATGEDDPVSSNVTLDGGFSRKDFGLDRAYVDWHPGALRGAKLLGGKMANPLHWLKDLDLIWDDDLNPEGGAIVYRTSTDRLDVLANAVAFSTEERSSGNDSYIYGGQLGARIKQDKLSVAGGAGFYYFDNMQGYATLYDETDGFGNSVEKVTDADTGDTLALLYANDFEIVELGGLVEAKMKLPLSLYGSYIVNTAADSSEDTGYLVGARLGQAKAPGSYQLDYTWRHLEADATVGAFTDSDFAGGGTDVEGHRIRFKYQIAKNWQGGISLFFNDIGISGDAQDYERGQFDLMAKF